MSDLSPLSGGERKSDLRPAKSAFDPERTLAQGELTSTSACFGEVDAGSPTRTYAILRMEAAGVEQD
jgi:hypothetical protein